MPQQELRTVRLFSTLALAGLALASLQGEVRAAAPQEASARPTCASEAPTASMRDVARRLALADDLELEAFRARWMDLPAGLQLELALEVRALDSDRSAWILVEMLDAHSAVTRTVAHAALRAETGSTLPAVREQWLDLLDFERAWLRMRGAEVVAELHSADEAMVIAATRELAEHRVFKRAFAPELERNLGRLSLGIRSVTARALGELGYDGSRDALRCALDDRAAAVRREAQAALRRLETLVG